MVASHGFRSVPKLVSVGSPASEKTLGVQPLSVTQAVQLAPLPSTVVCKDVPKDAESDGP